MLMEHISYTWQHFYILDGKPGDGTKRGDCEELYEPDTWNCHSNGECAFCVDSVAIYVGSDEDEVGIVHSGCFESNLPICDPETGKCVECSCKDYNCDTNDENDEDTCRIGGLGECKWLRFEVRSKGCHCNPDNNLGCPDGMICQDSGSNDFNTCI